MPKEILIPVDKSEQSEHAIDYAMETFPDANILLLNVFPNVPEGTFFGTEGGSNGSMVEERQKMLDTTVEDLEHRGDIETAVREGKPSREITGYARDNDVDQIVIGSHGRSGVTRVLLGSVAETVARRAPVPVTIVR
ncbi:MAG: universal stress protein [Halobacteria archaeon]